MSTMNTPPLAPKKSMSKPIQWWIAEMDKLLEDYSCYVNEQALLSALIELQNTHYMFSQAEFDKLLDRFDEGPKNLCLECKVDMGRMNPRQLCGKTRCISD